MVFSLNRASIVDVNDFSTWRRAGGAVFDEGRVLSLMAWAQNA
jgi:hypothetical protein